MASPVFPGATSSAASLPPLPPQPPEHPHRHHHGEMTVPSSQDGDGGPPEQPDEEPAEAYPTRHLPTSPVLFAGTIMSTPVLVPVRPTRIGPPDDGGLLQPTRVYTAYAEVTPSATPVFYSEIEPSASSDLPSTQVTEPLPSSSSTPAGSSSSSGSASTSETSSPTSGSTYFSPGSSPSFSTEPTSPSPEDTESPSPQSPSLPTFPTERSTTEKVEYGVKNIPPQLAHRLPKLALTAGKTFRYSIPSDTFSDLEDGDTKKLRLIFMHLNKTSIMSSSWVQFDIEKQEIYALPLEEHVSKWEFLLEAMDKEGSSVTETLALQVQHHKARRAVNHEFMISLRPPDRIHYASNLDWELDLLNAVARTVGDADNSHITVRAVNTSADPNIFAWTNDSLPRSPCPKEEIEQIMQMLADKSGSPSQRLKEAVPNSLHLRKVSWRGLAPCDRPQVHPGPPQPRNFPPVTRNPIDEIEAIEGRLLVFKVPSDMFYDPELQPLKVTLMTINNQPIPKESWLQFDSRNWEFYGLPMIGDKGRTEYNLVCEDSEGLMAYDALVVVVRPAPDVQYTAEFSMELQVPFEQFSLSASLKRRFIERIRDLFGDRDTSAVALARNPRPRGGGGGGGGGTVVTWYNASLPADRCSEHSIRALRRVLLQDDESVATRVRHIMDLEFPVESVTLTPTGACLGAMTEVHVDVAPSAAPDRKDTVPVGTPGDDYLVTYIVPAVIIVAMLLLAGLVACVLYRRRRTGKMSVGDEDERQSFRNKGIPVIFQDELEERPDPANKSPVIMKEEKPPLPPPEYQRGAESTPGTDRGTPPPAAVSAAAAAPGPGVAAAAVRRPLLGPDGSPAPAPEDPPYQPPPPFTSSRDTGRGARPKPTPTYRKPPPYVPP